MSTGQHDPAGQEPALGGGRQETAARRAGRASPRLGGEAALLHALEALHDQDSVVRERAAEALGYLDDARAIASLIALLADPNTQVRRRAVWALACAGDESAVPALAQALTDSDVQVRQYAAGALGRIGGAAAVDRLLEALARPEPNARVRERLVEALGHIGDPRAVPGLLTALRESNYLTYIVTLRRAITTALERIGQPAAPAMIKTLTDENPRAAAAAADVLGQLAAQFTDPCLRLQAIQALVEALRHDEPYVRRAAIRALGRAAPGIGDEDMQAQVVQALLDLLQEGPLEPPAPPTIMLWTPQGPIRSDAREVPSSDTGLDLRSDAIEALGSLHDPRAVPVLIEAAQDADSDVRRAAVLALGQIGARRPAEAGQIIPALAARLSDAAARPFSREARLCDLAAEALRAIGTPEALEALAAGRQGRTQG